MYVTNIQQSALKYAEEFLGETQELRDTSVTQIREWLDESKSEFHARNDYIWILSFLRGCKFDIEKTKTKIRNHLILRAETPEWFTNRNPFLSELQDLLNIGVFLPLRDRDSEGRLVVVIRTGAHDPKKHKQIDVFKLCKMILDVCLQEMEETTVYGVVAVFDMTGVTLGHALQLTPTIVKNTVYAWQNYYCKPKSLDFINAPSHVNLVLNVFKQFMSKKLKGRVHVHKGPTDMKTVISENILPKNYGGNYYSLEELAVYWKNKVEEYRDWLKDDEQYKALKLNHL